MQIIKHPEFENDSFYFIIKDFDLSIEKLNSLIKEDEYLSFKDKAFAEERISTTGCDKFIEDRPSLRNLKKMNCLESSIYTHAVNRKNNMGVPVLYHFIKRMIEKDSRRALLNFNEELAKSYCSEFVKLNLDISCLSTIHYLKDKVTISFRANDIKNEALFDFMLIYKYFIRNVYEKEIDIHVFCSSCQNFNCFYLYVDNLKKMYTFYEKSL